ncbi:MAG: peptidylprolyl isomerase [Pseudomonadota bacterium]
MRHYFASACLIVSLAAPAVAQDADTVLATVNGKDITLGHLIAIADSLPPQFQQLPDEQLFNGLLEQFIRQQAIATRAGDNPSRALRLQVEAQEAALIATTIVSKRSAVIEEDVRAEYERIYVNAAPAPELNASHILVATEAEALSLVAQLAEGADFSELAKTFSTGPSGPNGGNLAWFEMGQMVPPFEAAALALEVGEVSGPVETQFGWHVLTLNDRREASVPAFEAVRDGLFDQLAEERAQSVLDAALEAATIVRAGDEVDPALIRDLELIAD